MPSPNNQDGMTALRKPSGGVRGIVAGDIIRRLVYASLREHLQSFARIRIHGGKTQVWNRSG